MNENTSDLSKLGYREIGQLAELLKEYADNGSDFLENGVNWEYNPNSDNLFLVDEDGNVGMMNPETGKLEEFMNCERCPNESFATEMVETEDEGILCQACDAKRLEKLNS